MLQLLKDNPKENLGIHVVWVPMLGSDNETAAKEASRLFHDSRVRQYWDPERRSGTSYAKDVFPNYVADIHVGLRTSLPPDHWWHERVKTRGQDRPDQAPLWDVAFLYKSGVRWTDQPPEPHRLIKQIFYYGSRGNEVSGMFFTDFSKPPFETDWAVELRKAFKKLRHTARL